MYEPMWWWPAIPLGIVWAAALITFIVDYRKNKAVKAAAPIVIFPLVFAVILFIVMGASNERYSGVYAYYVNGARVAAGSVHIVQNIFLSLFGGMLLNLSAIGVAYLCTHGIRVGKWMNYVAVYLIIFGTLMLIVPFIPAIGLADSGSRKTFLIIAAATLIPGIILLILYQKNKKNVR